MTTKIKVNAKKPGKTAKANGKSAKQAIRLPGRSEAERRRDMRASAMGNLEAISMNLCDASDLATRIEEGDLNGSSSEAFAYCLRLIIDDVGQKLERSLDTLNIPRGACFVDQREVPKAVAS